MYSYQLSKKRIEEFLDNGLGKNQSNKNSYKNILLKVRESENYYDTYIYNFSRDQYCNFLKALKIPSILSIPPYVTYIKDYVKWCKEEGYCYDIETILNVQKQEYKTFVYNKAIYFKNREDVYRRLKKVNNPQEKVIVILLFEGISGGKAEDSFDEIINLKKNNCFIDERRILTFRNDGTQKEYKNLDPRTMKIIKEAIEQKIFLRNNGEIEKFKKIPLVDSERVVRPEKRKKIKDSASVTMIDKRIKNLKKWLEMPSLNSKNIIFSGIFDKLQERESEKGKLEKNDYITIGNDFGISANRYSYLKEIFGSFKIAENVNTEFLELAEIIEDKKMLVEEEEDTFLESDFENISLVEKKTPNNKSSNIKKAKKAQLSGNHKKDYIKEQIKKNKIGKIGEQLVIKYERKMLEQMGRQDLSKRVSWASEEKGDNLGYDIKSFIIENGKEKEIVIEVKSTTGPADIPFEITRKEVEVSEEIDEYYFIYRVFGIKKSKKNIGFYKVRGKVTRNFNLEPQIYIASVKSLNSHQRSTDN